MSFLDKLFDDILGFNPPDTSGADRLRDDAIAEARAAREATAAALAKAEAAMVDPRDSEAARKAAESAMRRRKSTALDVFSGGALGAAPIGYSTLTGGGA